MKTPVKQEKKHLIEKKLVKKEAKAAPMKPSQTKLEKKNTKDAMENKNMRPPFEQKRKFGDMAKAKAGIAAKSTPTTKAAPATKTAERKIGDMAKDKVAAESAPTMQKRSVSKKTAYDIKEASNSKLTTSARKHYARNAQAAMKNTKKK